MAGAEYYGCDVCGAKTFYDAELDYESHMCGVPANPDTGIPWPSGVGYMVVLCPACAETHAVKIIEIAADEEAPDD